MEHTFSSNRTRNANPLRQACNKSMKNFETHHVTIDLNSIDPQSTLHSTQKDQPTTTLSQMAKMIKIPKNGVKSTQKKNSPIKEFIQNTLRDEYVIKQPPKDKNLDKNYYLYKRNFSKESDMCRPVDCDISHTESYIKDSS
jgi:hypothetical protein